MFEGHDTTASGRASLSNISLSMQKASSRYNLLNQDIVICDQENWHTTTCSMLSTRRVFFSSVVPFPFWSGVVCQTGQQI